ncbi:MAG: hypothetical protein ACT4PT_03325 [Methanobacteriota archaeon]
MQQSLSQEQMEEKMDLWLAGFDPVDQGWSLVCACSSPEAPSVLEGYREVRFEIEAYISPLGKLSWYAKPLFPERDGRAAGAVA